MPHDRGIISRSTFHVLRPTPWWSSTFLVFNNKAHHGTKAQHDFPWTHAKQGSLDKRNGWGNIVSVNRGDMVLPPVIGILDSLHRTIHQWRERPRKLVRSIYIITKVGARAMAIAQRTLGNDTWWRWE